MSRSRWLVIARSSASSITDVPQAGSPLANRHALRMCPSIKASAPGAGTITDDAPKDAREESTVRTKKYPADQIQTQTAMDADR
jgi:hypothetical protein